MKKVLTVLFSLLFLPFLHGTDGVLSAKRKVHTIGDSTMSDYKPAATPKRGWGMYLQAFFNADSIEVNNRGKSGASTRTFYETDNLWPSVKQQMSTGDYLIIQFAHNDEKCKGEDVYVENARLRAEGKDTLTDMRGTEPNTTYKDYLRRFVNEARAMGVKPILMSPICRAYFQDGKINDEGRHDLSKNGVDKNYVRCMREVAEEMNVPFLDMTASSQSMYETMGQRYCMEHYFSCGDKTHTGQEGGMVIATCAYRLIANSQELSELHHLIGLPPVDKYHAYVMAIEERGKQAAILAKGDPFNIILDTEKAKLVNMERTEKGYTPIGGVWPAGEIDEVANRYIEYAVSADKKRGLVIEMMSLPIKAKGGEGMNLHINYGFGERFRDVTTIYENTALPNDQHVLFKFEQPIVVPAGETLYIRVLPWYDSNGRPQKKKYLQFRNLQVSGKKLK